MTFEELKDWLLILSNQYYIGQDALMMDDTVLQGLIDRAISTYNNYRPQERIEFIDTSDAQLVSGNLYAKRLDYITDENNIQREILQIKQIYVINPLFSKQPIPYQWKYNRNTKLLYIGLPGTYYFDLLVGNTLDDFTKENKEFIDLILGLYLMYVASPRKNFTLSELPFENDANELYQIGAQLYADTIERLGERDGSWFLAID